MAKKMLIALVCLSLFSCSGELEEKSLLNSLKNESFLQVERNDPAIVKDIKNYITHLKFGEVKTLSKASEAYSLSPYVYKGDTVMYIVNYTDGWELISTDHRTPLILASSATGYYDINSTAMEPGPSAYISSVADELYQLKQIPDDNSQAYGLWQAITINNDEVNPESIEVAAKASGTQPGVGYWELLNTTKPVTSVYTSSRLISTYWGQGYPWNQFVPFVAGSTTQHCLAGCTPVAGAQYLHYLHYKNNRPAATVTTAAYQSSSNTYIYTGSSSSIWDQMAKTYSSGGTNYAATLIGYVGKEINAKYGESSTPASFADLLSLINRSGYNYSEQNIDYSYVLDQLRASNAVLTLAYSLDPKDKNKEKKVGHVFIIDGYERTTIASTSTFGWVGKDNIGNDTNEYDIDGNIIGYSFTYENENTTNSWVIMMNWGWDNDSSNNTRYTADNNAAWNANIYNFNSDRKIAR